MNEFIDSLFFINSKGKQMGFGFFKKLKDAFKKTGQFIKNKVIKPVINTAKKVVKSPITKQIIDTGMKLAPVIGAGISSATGGSPQSGMQAGHVIQGIGKGFGFG